MKLGIWLFGFCIILLFLSGCVDEKEKTDLIALCNTKTNIKYTDSPDCLIAGKCNNEYNFQFGFELKSETLKKLGSAKSNYEKAIIDSWVSISNLLKTTDTINASCEEITSDDFVSNLQYLYSYSKLSSSDLSNLGYRQTILLGSIKKTLEAQDINLLADTKLYKYYTNLTDNWNTTLGDIVVTNQGFNLQTTQYNSWSTFNNRFLYAPNKISADSVAQYKNIIGYGLLQEQAIDFIFGDISLPKNTLLTSFAELLFDNINSGEVSYEQLSNIFENYFNLSDFIKEYTGLFGYKGAIIKLVSGDLENLDLELREFEKELEQKKVDLILRLNNLDLSVKVTDEQNYVGSFFGANIIAIDYSEKVGFLKLKLTNFNGTLGQRYELLKSADLEIKNIENAVGNIDKTASSLIFACNAKINSIYAENQNTKYYYDKFKKNQTIENCYLFLKSLDNLEKLNCSEKIGFLEKNFGISTNQAHPCEELELVLDNLEIYLSADLLNTVNDFKDYFSKLGIIKSKRSDCINQEYTTYEVLNTEISTSHKLFDYLYKNGLVAATNNLTISQKGERELFTESLQCYLEKIYSISKDKLSFSTGFSDNTKIDLSLPIGEIVQHIEGTDLEQYSCTSKICKLTLTQILPVMELTIVKTPEKYKNQEINYEDILEVTQKYCFSANTVAPELEKDFTADKINIYSESGKTINYKSEKNIFILPDFYAEKDSCIFIKYSFTNAITKTISLDSSEKIDEYTTRLKYNLTITNNLAVLQKGVAIKLDFYPDNSQEISIFDGGGKEYKPIIGNKGIYFSTELKPLSETRFSILFYVKDERKNFISTISNLKDDCKELLDSNSFAIKRAAEELMSEINTLSTFTPENNSAALSELTKIRNKITGLISDDKKYNIKFEERSLYLQRLKNARAFLETLKDNKTSIDSTLIKNSDLSELSSDLSLISTEISKLENNKESDFNTSIENISKKYVIDLELYVGGLKTEYQNSKEYSKLLYSEFNDLDSEFDCLFNNLYFEDYNSFFVNLETYLKESKTNEQNLNLKVIEKKKQIDAKFGGIDKIKSNLNSAWDKYNALVGQFNSKDFESAKKVEKIPFTSTEVKNNKTLLDSVSKEILSIDSLKDTFEKEYLKNDKKAVINFEDKKIDKVNYNYELASKNLDTIESKLQLIASENIALAEEQNGNKELLYDAKNSLENGDYFKAIINAKNAMFGASTSGSNVAIYGLGIVIFAIIAYVMYVLFNNRKRKKKVTYYTVPK